MPADRCLSGATRTFFSVAALRRLCVRWTTSVVVDPFRRPATPTGHHSAISAALREICGCGSGRRLCVRAAGTCVDVVQGRLLGGTEEEL